MLLCKKWIDGSGDVWKNVGMYFTLNFRKEVHFEHSLRHDNKNKIWKNTILLTMMFKKLIHFCSSVVLGV